MSSASALRRDPVQRLYATVNHEAGHALGMFLMGWEVAEIDVDRPSDDALGHVRPIPPTVTIPPELEADEAAVLAWLRGQAFHEARNYSVALRLGGMFAGQSWHDLACSSDRANVELLRPQGFTRAAWEAFVELGAERVLEDRRLCHAHGALAGALLEDRRRVMPGDRAFSIIRAALDSFDSEGLAR